MPNLYDFTMQSIDGDARSLADLEGKVALIVNVASECGLTPQYDGLQRLYELYQTQGLEVLAFPCNQFGGQEPGSGAEIQEFCSRSFGVTFPLSAKVDVNGPDRAPLYEWLTGVEAGPEGPGDIPWNFAKFVVGREGEVIARFAPRVEPQAPEVIAAIESALG